MFCQRAGVTCNDGLKAHTLLLICCLRAEHFEHLYNLAEKKKWEKQCLCFRKKRVTVDGYDGSKYERVKKDETISHFDPEGEKNNWTIKGGWIAEVRLYLTKQ